MRGGVEVEVDGRWAEKKWVMVALARSGLVAFLCASSSSSSPLVLG